MPVTAPVRALPLLAALLFTGVVAPAAAAQGVPSEFAELPSAAALLETPTVYDDDAGRDADADDPAIWVHPTDRRRSLVIATLKNGGLDVYDLQGRLLQNLATPPAPGPDLAAGRFNNVDLVHDFKLARQRVDLAVVSDRGRDRLRSFVIDPKAAAAGRPPLTDVTALDAPRVFSATEADIEEQATAYGLTAWQPNGRGAAFVIASQRSRTALAMLRLETTRNGRVSYERVDTTAVPSTYRLPDGTSWTPCEDPGDGPQVEGMVVDRKRHELYAGQEQVGIHRVALRRKGFASAPVLVEKVREFGVPATYDPVEEECVQSGEDPGFGGEHLSADVEGLTIARRPGRGGDLLLASSQGDDTYAAFADAGGGGFVGSFTIDLGDDRVQESDGADVVTVDLGPGLRSGLLVTQDGEDTGIQVDPDRDPTNFKFTPFERVLAALRR